MVNGVLLLPVVNLPGSIGERGGRRREIVAGKNGEGGRERERARRKMEEKRTEFEDDGVSRCGKFISTITGARRMAACVR